MTPEEYAYLVDLHLFLGKSVTLASLSNPNGDIGRIPQSGLEEQHTAIISLHDTHTDLISMRKVTENAQQQYVRSRPAASVDSNKRVKELSFGTCTVHPVFGNDSSDHLRENLLDQMKIYRPHGVYSRIDSVTL